MNKIVFNSFRLINLSSVQPTNCRYFCKSCLNKQNYLKFNYFGNVLIESKTKTTFSTILSFKPNFQIFGNRVNFSTFSARNQRLNDVQRNAVKDKSTDKSSKLSKQEINEWNQMKNLSLTKKLKFMLTKYWYISLPVHFVTSILWFGSAYLIAKSGFDVKPILEFIKPYAERLPLPEFVVKILNSDTNASSAGYLAIALILYKLATPARYASTVGVSFYAIQFFVKRGLIRPAPSGQQIKAQVSQSRTRLKKVLKERLAKREELRKKPNPRHKKHK